MNASIRWVTQALDVFGVSKYLDVVTPALVEILVNIYIYIYIFIYMNITVFIIIYYYINLIVHVHVIL